jgi:hypothetical protein
MVLKAQQDWIVWVAAAAMVVSLGLHASRVVRLLSDQGTAPAVRRDHAEVVESQIDMDSVLALMPFGQPIEVPPSNTAPASNPRLTLLGVVRADPISRSSAILSVGKEPARTYFVGDEVANGLRLVEVQGDHVLLEVGDVKERLSLTDTSPPVLPRSDSVSRAAGATGDFDALRQLIFDQVNGRGDIAPVPLPHDEVVN